MFTHYRTHGFFLRKINFGEADQLFVVYTKDFGKLEILGKAIRKIKSKLRQGAELFYLSEIEFIQGKTFKTLTDAVVIDKFNNLRKNLKKSLIARKFLEIASFLIKNQEQDKKIWELLEDFFKKINDPKLNSSFYIVVYYYFLWNFFAAMGYEPDLYHCIFCQKRLIFGENYFYPKEGGIFCHNCFVKNGYQLKNKRERFLAINENLIKILRMILKRDINILLRLKINQLPQENLKKVSEEFFYSISNLPKN